MVAMLCRKKGFSLKLTWIASIPKMRVPAFESAVSKSVEVLVRGEQSMPS